MRQVVFKPYISFTNAGTFACYDTSTFNIQDLRDMLSAPEHLERVNFRTAHQIWGKHAHDLFRSNSDPGSKKLIAFTNLGFVQALASLGFRCVPESSEIEVL